ncbi:hypothetical protein ACIHFD_49405 [Nonomuraea sp. NPDC051941]|uniref:hypothetical protein n=1 Tax=Nonomuraea sp. NPDC051941 TaxID=3364373 RepID=UPI0037C77EFA
MLDLLPDDVANANSPDDGARAHTSDDVAGAFAAGTSIRDLARTHRCSQKAIFQRLVAAGAIQKPLRVGGPARLTPAQRKALVAAYRAETPMDEIADKFGVSVTTARRVAAAAGAPPRGPGARRRLPHRRIKALAARGKSAKEIAAAVGSSPAYIRILLADRSTDRIRPAQAASSQRRSGPPPMWLDLETMAEQYTAGMSVREIAKEHGCSVSLLYRRFRRAGVRLRGRITSTRDTSDEIVAAYVAGWSVLDICATYAVAKSTVARLAEDAGVQRRPSGAPRETNWDEIARLIDQGESTKETAAAVGCTPRQVARVLGALDYSWDGRKWHRPEGRASA